MDCLWALKSSGIPIQDLLFFLTDGFEGWQMESYDMGVSQNELTTKIIGFLLDQNSFYWFDP